MVCFTFSTKSYTLQTSYLRHSFLPTIGYVGQSCCFRSLANRTLGLQIDSRQGYHGAIYGECALPNLPLDYLEKMVNEYKDNGYIITRKHNIFNIMTDKLNAMDRFLCSLKLLIDPQWYVRISNTLHHNRTHLNEVKFQKLPFQQFMLLDKLITMLLRSDISEYADLILMEMKQSIGLPSLTLSRCYSLLNTFNKKVIIHVVPRRHGKTVFSNYLNALCLVFFPTVNLKTVYIAHKKDLTDNAFSTALDLLEELADGFNYEQKTSYEQRQGLRQSGKNDFYYTVDPHVTHGTLIVCSFQTHSNKGLSKHTSQILRNEYRCTVYCAKDVSLIIWNIIKIKTPIK